MKKIMTAIGNIKLINILKKEKDIEIINKDILYKEAIIDILEKENNIDSILINENIPGDIDLIDLILKIKEINKKIEIIIFLEKENKLLEKKLKLNNINKIYYNNKIKLNNFIKFIKNEKIIGKNKLEKKEYKKIIVKIKNYIKKIKEKMILKGRHNTKNNGKIINFVGIPGSGKTLMSLMFTKYLINENYKVLLIDADINKKDISTVLGIKIKNNKKIKIKNKINKKYKDKKINKKIFIEKYLKIKKINKNLFFFIKIEKIIKNNNLFDFFINYIKNKFDFIIIDMGFYNNIEINKKIIEKSDFNIILLEPNLLGIKGTKILLEKINKLKNNKFNIIINKENNFSVDVNILKNCFYDIKFLGKIKLNI